MQATYLIINFIHHIKKVKETYKINQYYVLFKQIFQNIFEQSIDIKTLRL